MAGFPPLYAALVPERVPQPPALPEPPAGNYRVFVVDWGYHTAIVVEQPRGWRLGPPGAEDAPFLEYAWGDRRFYYESDYWPHSVFATLFLPTDAVLYLDAHPDPPRFGSAEAVFARTVDAETVRTLLAALERTVRHDTSGARLAALAPAPGYRGRLLPGARPLPVDAQLQLVGRRAARRVRAGVGAGGGDLHDAGARAPARIHTRATIAWIRARGRTAVGGSEAWLLSRFHSFLPVDTHRDIHAHTTRIRRRSRNHLRGFAARASGHGSCRRFGHR